MNKSTRLAIIVSISIVSLFMVSAALAGASGARGLQPAANRARDLLLDPRINLVKTVNTTPGTCPGANSITVLPGTPVNYCYQVTNTGSVTLTLHTLTDNKLGVLIPVNTPILLPPAASYTFSTTAVITQSVVNTGNWTADDGLGNIAVDNDNASVTVLMPTITLTKTVSDIPETCALIDEITVITGSSVTYCYEIENTGAVTVTSHTLFDDALGAIFTDTLAIVGPGETMVFSTTIEINEDTVNTATWTAEEPFGNQAQAVDTATVHATDPGLTLFKTVTADVGVCPGTDDLSVVPETEVTYCFELKNTGTTTLTTHTLIDDHLGTILDGQSIEIAPGGSHQVSVDIVITQDVSNLATWTATDVFENELETSDAASVEITGLSIDLEKTVGTALTECSTDSMISVLAGTTVSYCYQVTNTGVVTLTTHTLVDSQFGLILNGEIVVLPPGETYIYTKTAVIQSTVTNNANWTATDTFGNPAASSGSATVNVVAPEIQVTPESIVSSQALGTVVTAILSISNTGTTDLTWSAEENQSPAGPVAAAPEDLGDVLFNLDFGALLDNDVLLGVEFDGSSFWATAGGVNFISEPNLLYEFDRTGVLLNTFTNTVDSAGFGWRDLAFDGSMLYASAGDAIDQIDRSDGQPTGITITLANTGLDLARAIAYDPATDHFWVADFSSQIYEIDRDGVVINSFPSIGHPIFGFAWDDVSPGGPFLWAWTANNPPNAHQIDPATGQLTGVSFTGIAIPGGAGGGGATITPDLVPDRLVLIGMHQAASDTVVGYDLGVSTGSCAPHDVPWLSISPSGGVIAAGDGVEVDIVLDSTGLTPGFYYANLCIASNDPDEPILVVPVTMIVGLDFQIHLPVILRVP